MITTISLIVVISVAALQWWGQWKFTKRQKSITELWRKLYKNEEEMGRLRDSLINSWSNNDIDEYRVAHELMNSKIDESLQLIQRIKDESKSRLFV